MALCSGMNFLIFAMGLLVIGVDNRQEFFESF